MPPTLEEATERLHVAVDGAIDAFAKLEEPSREAVNALTAFGEVMHAYVEWQAAMVPARELETIDEFVARQREQAALEARQPEANSTEEMEMRLEATGATPRFGTVDDETPPTRMPRYFSPEKGYSEDGITWYPYREQVPPRE